MSMQDSYLAALKNCEKISQNEFKHASGYSKQCDEVVRSLNREFLEIIIAAEKVTTKSMMAVNGLQDIKNCLGPSYEVARAKQAETLGQQKEVLKKFSVMLFGRTMAGKSTIREAITKGDGSTIGKGAQRTTRDVREYEWNRLRIIDTPGFGAFNGEEDTNIARGILEQSDVILFMLNSDSIQESTFTELEYVYRLNKPLVFVINVKKDLEKDIYRKKAIQDPDNYLYPEDKLAGHKQRLKETVVKLGMNPKHIKIIAIHAQAAFLATQNTFKEHSEDLHRISKIDSLLSLLTNEITYKGSARRIQTLLGSALNHTGDLERLINEQRSSVNRLLEEYGHTYSRTYTWHARTAKRIPQKIEKDVGLIFSNLTKSISSFVDDNIQHEGFGERLKKYIDSFRLEERCKNLAVKIVEEIDQDLSQFNKDMAINLELSGKINISTNNSSFDPFDYKRMNGWLSASFGVLSTVAFLNSWNPVGWGLAAFGLAFGLFQMFSQSKNKMLQSEKHKRTSDIRGDIEANRNQVVNELIQWFYNDIEQKKILVVKTELQEVCIGLKEFVKSLDQAIFELDKLEHAINKRYLLQIMSVANNTKFNVPKIKRIVRQPGYACYFIVSNYFKEPDLLLRVQDLLGEKVRVIYESSIENMIRHVLDICPNDSKVTNDNGEYIVYVKESQLGRVLGKQHRNIMLASAICEVKLTAKPLK